MSNPAVFVDRDGTLIRDVGYLCRLDQVEILPGVSEGLRLLRRHGFKIVMITNQSAVARGLISEEELKAIHSALEARLVGMGSRLDGVYYCPHHPTEGKGSYRVWCECRKPKAGLVEKAWRGLGQERGVSYVVGDQMTDMEMASRIGSKGVLVASEYSDSFSWEKIQSVASVQHDFRAAARWIVQNWLETGGRISLDKKGG